MAKDVPQRCPQRQLQSQCKVSLVLGPSITASHTTGRTLPLLSPSEGQGLPGGHLKKYMCPTNQVCKPLFVNSPNFMQFQRGLASDAINHLKDVHSTLKSWWEQMYLQCCQYQPLSSTLWVPSSTKCCQYRSHTHTLVCPSCIKHFTYTRFPCWACTEMIQLIRYAATFNFPFNV